MAAAATGFAATTVEQTAAMLRGARRPHLMPNGFTIEGKAGAFLGVGNAGGGLAGPVSYLWVLDTMRYAEGVAGLMLATGRDVVIEAPTGRDAPKKHRRRRRLCVDAKGNGYVWSFDDPKGLCLRRWRGIAAPASRTCAST